MKNLKLSTAVIWPNDPARLSVVQDIFAVIMALGLETMVENSYVYWKQELGFIQTNSERAPILYFLPMVVMMFLGFRFFWAVVNVRRYIEQADRKIRSDADHNIQCDLRKKFERKVVLLHVPALIIHGFLFYFGSHIVSDILFSIDNTKTVITFIIYYTIYQYINVLWLWLLIRDFDSHSIIESPREQFWIKNNTASSSLGVVILFFITAERLSVEIGLVAACFVFIGSSVADLATTAFHYLESPDNQD